MTQLNDKIPELYQLALERYNTETQNLHDRYNALGTQEDRRYGQWRDERESLASDRDYYSDNYSSERDYDMTLKQNEYKNLMDLLNYRTNLEVRDVTSGTSETHSSEMSGSSSTSNENSTEKNTTKNTTKSSETNKTTNSTTSKDNQSSITNTQSSGRDKSGGSSKTNVNKTSGTTTPDSKIKEVMSRFEEKLKVGYDTETGTFNEKSVNDAWDYLTNQVDKTILKEDFDWIDIVTGAPHPKK